MSQDLDEQTFMLRDSSKPVHGQRRSREMADMPIDLVLVRHGQSEGDLAQDRSKRGDDSDWEKGMANRHTSKYLLTEVGREQARQTGIYIQKEFGAFDRHYVSEYARARETAALMNIGGSWYVDFFLRERDWGVLGSRPRKGQSIAQFVAVEMEGRDRDSFYWAPPGGESMANACLRVFRVLVQLQRSCSGFKVIIVCHGNIMRCFRACIEQFSSKDFDVESQTKIHKCQVIHYSRRDPVSGRVHTHLQYRRTFVPWDMSLEKDTGWKMIERRVFSDQALMQGIEDIPQLLNKKTVGGDVEVTDQLKKKMAKVKKEGKRSKNRRKLYNMSESDVEKDGIKQGRKEQHLKRKKEEGGEEEKSKEGGGTEVMVVDGAGEEDTKEESARKKTKPQL